MVQKLISTIKGGDDKSRYFQKGFIGRIDVYEFSNCECPGLGYMQKSVSEVAPFYISTTWLLAC